MIKTAYVKSSEAIVKITLEEKYYFKVLKDEFLYSYIPSVSILEDCFTNYDAEINFINSDTNEISLTYPNISFQFIKCGTKDIISFIEYVLERARQDKGIICVHGAASIVNDKAIICWGTTTGMGKTTLALCLANNYNKFYSDEKVLIDLKRSQVVGRIDTQYISNSYWEKKLGNKKYYKRENISGDIIYDISMFVQPIICDQEQQIYDVWSPEKFMWHLYEESSRKIRGTTRIFFNNIYTVQSLDAQDVSNKRLQLIKNFTKNIKAVYFKGSSENVIKTILNKNS